MEIASIHCLEDAYFDSSFFEKQLACWPDAKERYANLEDVRLCKFDNGLTLQYNPSRAVSTAAKVDADSVKKRECFLCAANRPSCQIAEDAFGSFDVLVNPYPILPYHFTLPLKEHTPQLLEKMYSDMLLLKNTDAEISPKRTEQYPRVFPI